MSIVMMIEYEVLIYFYKVSNRSCLSVFFVTKLLFPSELSAAGAKRGVRRLQLPKWSPPDDPF